LCIFSEVFAYSKNNKFSLLPKNNERFFVVGKKKEESVINFHGAKKKESSRKEMDSASIIFKTESLSKQKTFKANGDVKRKCCS